MHKLSDIAFLFLRVSGSFFILILHGMPKIFSYSEELKIIEDPFGIGSGVTLMLAIFAEVFCPIFIIIGVFTRLACIPIIFLLLVSLLVVHPSWSIQEAQFAWLYVIIFLTIIISGSGSISFLNSNKSIGYRFSWLK